MGCDDDANLIVTDGPAHLWLGNRNAALNFNFLKDANISVIINCTKEIPFIHEINNKDYTPLNIETIRIPIYDSNSNSDNKILYDALKPTLEFLDTKFLKEKKNILIHCAAGKSRSASVIAAFIFYMIKYKSNHYKKKPLGLSDKVLMNNVITYIVKRRPCAFYYGRIVNFKKALESFFNIT